MLPASYYSTNSGTSCKPPSMGRSWRPSRVGTFFCSRVARQRRAFAQCETELPQSPTLEDIWYPLPCCSDDLADGSSFLKKTKRRPLSDRPHSNQSASDLSRHFFQLFLVNVKIRIYVLHVVLVLKRFQQADHLAGGGALQLDVILRHHAQ